MTINIYNLLLIIVAALLVINIALILAKKTIRTKEKPKPRKLLTKAEYKMYYVLKEALPEYKILLQVSFAAMLKAEHRGTVNTFLAKRADFVICDQALNVLLIIELDDWSHKGREKEDRMRDSLLINAGYKVIHLNQIPNYEEMRKIFIEHTKICI